MQRKVILFRVHVRDAVPEDYRITLERRETARAPGLTNLHLERLFADRLGQPSWRPMLFCVRLPDGTTLDYEVEREMVAEFIVESDPARERRLAAAAKAGA